MSNLDGKFLSSKYIKIFIINKHIYTIHTICFNSFQAYNRNILFDLLIEELRVMLAFVSPQEFDIFLIKSINITRLTKPWAIDKISNSSQSPVVSLLLCNLQWIIIINMNIHLASFLFCPHVESFPLLSAVMVVHPVFFPLKLNLITYY